MKKRKNEIRKWGTIIIISIFVIFFILFIIYFRGLFNLGCKGITQCYIKSTNITCTFDKDCISESFVGICNENISKCGPVFLSTSEKRVCLKAGGEWIEGGC